MFLLYKSAIHSWKLWIFRWTNKDILLCSDKGYPFTNEWFLLESSILILSVLIGHYLWRSGLPKLRLLADLFSSYLLFNFYFFKSWVQEKCNPLVREITFENAEELTEEGLPFLILFHHPDDTTSIKVGINSRLFSLINQSLI